MNTTNFLLILLGSCLILCFILMLINNSDTVGRKTNSVEGFDPVIDAIQSQLKAESPEALKSTVQALQQRLIDYGYAPDVNTFVKKTDLGPNDGKCLVSKAEDRDKYISKSDIPPPGPRIDLSQYVKKSSIPPEKVCPSQPEIDYSAYVKKSTLPPVTACAPCISPKVKVSAGLCRECPPAPSCPPAERCPEVVCPVTKPCPAEKKCPLPAPCPVKEECKKCDEIRYIKVPAIITKTVMVDQKGNIISQKIDSGNTNPTMSNTTTTMSNIPVATQVYREERREEKEERRERRELEERREIEREEKRDRELQKYKEEIKQYKEEVSKYKEKMNKYKEHKNKKQAMATMQSSSQSSSLPTPPPFMNEPVIPTMPTMPEMPEITTTTAPSMSSMSSMTTAPTPTSGNLFNKIFGMTTSAIPTTTFPQLQKCTHDFGSKAAYCSTCDLNSEFKSYGIYGPP